MESQTIEDRTREKGLAEFFLTTCFMSAAGGSTLERNSLWDWTHSSMKLLSVMNGTLGGLLVTKQNKVQRQQIFSFSIMLVLPGC